jgi:hypothetical protein
LRLAPLEIQAYVQKAADRTTGDTGSNLDESSVAESESDPLAWATMVAPFTSEAEVHVISNVNYG